MHVPPLTHDAAQHNWFLYTNKEMQMLFFAPILFEYTHTHTYIHSGWRISASKSGKIIEKMKKKMWKFFRFDYKALNLAAIVNHCAKQGINDLYGECSRMKNDAQAIETKRTQKTHSTVTIIFIKEEEAKNSFWRDINYCC